MSRDQSCVDARDKMTEMLVDHSLVLMNNKMQCLNEMFPFNKFVLIFSLLPSTKIIFDFVASNVSLKLYETRK